MSAEPLDEIQWKSPEWIQQFGLHTGNVLDYFSESPFYDRTSNNQVLRMQFQFQQIPPNIHPQKYFETRLTEMVGTEFVVKFIREPDFWVIRKQRRIDPHNAVAEQDYYIIGANVYQSPKIYDVLSARLLSTVLSMKSSISLLNNMTHFSISEGGHTYPSENAENGGNGASSSAGKSAQTSAGTAGYVSTPITGSNPGTVAQTTGATDVGSSGAMGESSGGASTEISATAFDNLLNNVVASTNNDKSIYLDDIPLYGKGSTVEQLGLKLNLDDDDD
ncbi:hypothetical protein JCM33374_g3749 [Metschnikowia sp. JCM 33374]|nr:hypothetical protein JCM33374_g3749 [Metschnikowia sp. JCM 33374]